MFTTILNGKSYSKKVIDQVGKDIDNFILNFVEASNIEGYSDKFPVCPYAKKARLDGESLVNIYSGGSVENFVVDNLSLLCDSSKYKVMLQIFPPRVRIFSNIDKIVNETNKWTIPKDYFSLLGRTPNIYSSYPGIFNSGEYLVIGTNKLSRVLPAVDKLSEMGYYDAPTWTDHHLNAVVHNRLRQYNLYK